MNRLLQESIKNQRRMIAILLEKSLIQLGAACADNTGDREKLDQILVEAFPSLPYCKYLYVMDPKGVQISANISADGVDMSQLGRDRSERPYMHGIYDAPDFHLSEAYISLSEQRPSLTATQMIRNQDAELVAIIGTDYDLRELPHTESLFKESSEWRQLKGDPAIRSHLFMQQRVQSRLDMHFAEVLSLLQELMEEHGVFHGKLHFSSSRATVWQVDNPYVYHLLDYEELSDPDTCLAFPRRPYFENAVVPKKELPKIFDRFRMLRFADDTVYLRSGSLNIANGIVGLNFSCDGTHYMQYDEFLKKGEEFWFGSLTQAPNSCDPDTRVADAIEQICEKGCSSVLDIIEQMDESRQVAETERLAPHEQSEVLAELKAIMSIYNDYAMDLDNA